MDNAQMDYFLDYLGIQNWTFEILQEDCSHYIAFAGIVGY